MKMKKVSALALAAAMITMGGVYAAWNYAESNAGTATQVVGVGLVGAVTDTATGKLAIVASDTFMVDQGTTEYDSTMVYNDIRFTFTPNAGASASVTENAIPVRVSFRLNNAGSYAEQPILKLNATHTNPTGGGGYDYFSFIINPVNITDQSYVEDNTDFNGDNVAEVKNWTKETDGSFSYTLSGDVLKKYVVYTSVKLETHAKYSEYADALRGALVQVRLADVTTVVQ